MNKSRLIALTGGIGSGKSTAAKFFRKFGIQVISADEIGHQLLKENEDIKSKVIEVFSSDILRDSGEINRDALRKIVFSDDKKRNELNAIMHPPIWNELLQRVSNDIPYNIAEIPLILEGNNKSNVDAIIVLDCDEEVQVKRVQERSKLSKEEVYAIISSQLPRKERLKHANFVLENNGTKEQLKEQVLKLHFRLLKKSDR